MPPPLQPPILLEAYHPHDLMVVDAAQPICQLRFAMDHQHGGLVMAKLHLDTHDKIGQSEEMNILRLGVQVHPEVHIPRLIPRLPGSKRQRWALGTMLACGTLSTIGLFVGLWMA